MAETERKVLKSLLKPRKKGEASKVILRVTVIKAEHLPAMDITGTSDPFCKLVYLGKSQKTNVVRETLDPEWNESFDFEYNPDASMLIEVYDWDLVGSNDYMGSVTISMASVTHTYTSSWHQLRDEKGNTVPFAKINLGVQQMTEAEAGIAPAGKNVSLMGAVISNLKPILSNIFRLLFVAIRPILLQLIVIRKLFIDWETPLQTIIASIVFLYVWYYKLILSFLILTLWWNFTKRLWTYRFFGTSYIGIDPNLKDKDMLKGFKVWSNRFDTKIELKYGRDDPISEDVQMVARVTGKISDKVLELQAFFNWQKPFVPSLIAWFGLLALGMGHSFVPWRDIFFWIFRIALPLGWFVATIIVPLLRIFPTATIKLKRFFTARGFLSHIKPKYTTPEGSLQYDELDKKDHESMVAIGVVQKVRADRELVERGQWPDLFFYPQVAVLRTGHTTHVKTYLKPSNILIGRLQALNPAFDAYSYQERHLPGVVTMQGGKLIVFEVSTVRLEFEQNPNLAFHFYRWLAFQLTKKNDRSAALKNVLNNTDSSAIEQYDDDPVSEVVDKKDIFELRNKERRRQQLISLYEKFGIPRDEGVLHIANDVYRRRMGKKIFGTVYVTLNHLAFLPGTAAQLTDRWIVEATDVETAFVDKNGALEILFAGDLIRHLYHDDRSTLNEVVSHINHMKTATSLPELEGGAAPPADSPQNVKRHNIRNSVQKAVARTLSRGTIGMSSRGSMSKRVSLPLRASAANSVSPLGSGPSTPTLSRPSLAPSTSAVAIDEDEDAIPNTLTDAEVSASLAGRKQLTVDGAEDWRYIHVADLMTPAALRKIMDPRMKRKFAAGSVILEQDVSREVAIQVLWSGSAKAVRRNVGKPDLFLGYINEGSVFGETAYLLEANAGASVIAITDCVVYSLSGPWLDGLFDMDRSLGAQFFEMICMVLFERSVLSEFILFKKQSAGDDGPVQDLADGGMDDKLDDSL